MPSVKTLSGPLPPLTFSLDEGVFHDPLGFTVLNLNTQGLQADGIAQVPFWLAHALKRAFQQKDPTLHISASRDHPWLRVVTNTKELAKDIAKTFTALLEQLESGRPIRSSVHLNNVGFFTVDQLHTVLQEFGVVEALTLMNNRVR